MTQHKTILNDSHRALGAKMVDFGGWDMPLHYGSQVEEHHLVRRDAGMFDVSHMTVVELAGARVREFLRQLVANSVDKLKAPGKALYTFSASSSTPPPATRTWRGSPRRPGHSTSASPSAATSA